MNELNYEKSQLLVDTEGQIWVLVDIVESTSLLDKSKKPSLIAYLRPKSKRKISKTSYQTFVSMFTPILSTDQTTVDKILALESCLEETGLHVTNLEN
jgi:hypothetical protein